MKNIGAKRFLTSALATVTAVAYAVGMVPTALGAESSKTEPTSVQPVKPVQPVQPVKPVQPPVKPVKPIKTVTDSKIIRPNRKFKKAKDKKEANDQVRWNAKKIDTYHLSVSCDDTATKKPLVEPYEITMASNTIEHLTDKDSYILLPQVRGYVVDTKNDKVEYYVLDKGKYVKDNGKFDASLPRYLHIDKKLMDTVCHKNKGAEPVVPEPKPVVPQPKPVIPPAPKPVKPSKAEAEPAKPKSVVTPVNPKPAPKPVVPGPKPVDPKPAPKPSKSDPLAGDVFSGKLTVHYTARTATFYVRHLLQDVNDPNKFDKEYDDAAKTIVFEQKDSKGKVEKIHVTKHTGIVGTMAHSQSLDIPGYRPEHNGTQAPVSDGDNLVLITRYYRRTYAVTYDTDGGNSMLSANVYLGATVPAAKDPVKRGYIFKGWTLDDPKSVAEHLKMNENGKNYGEQASFAMPAHDVCFKAKWEANPVTQYRVNVWVQKPDLVDKSNPESKANYDFVTAIARPGIKTGSEVSVDKMNDAGVVDGNISGTTASPVDGSSVGFKSDELTNNIIAKFNWMGDKPCTSLSGYNTADPYDPNNKGKDLFTRYFHVNKELTKKFNSQTKLDPNDLKNQFDIVYDRTVYDLIFAGSKEISEQTKSDVSGLGSIELKPLRTNAGVYRVEDGKKKLYCYPNNQNADTLVHDKSEYNGAEVVHDAYRAKVRYGQDLHGIMPLTDDILYDPTYDAGFCGWYLIVKPTGASSDDKDHNQNAPEHFFRDVPPYHFTRTEFADPEFTANENIPVDSKMTGHTSTHACTLADNQRLLSCWQGNSINQTGGMHVFIQLQTTKSTNNGGDKVYDTSPLTFYKEETIREDSGCIAPQIPGFEPVDYHVKQEKKTESELDDWLKVPFEAYKAYNNCPNMTLEEFKNTVHVHYRKHLVSDAKNTAEQLANWVCPIKYNRHKYDVTFYNPEVLAPLASEKLAFETNLSKRGYDEGTKPVSGSSRFAGKYTFTVDGKAVNLNRPDNIPDDYVFKGWARDEAGTEPIKDANVTVPLNGIKLFAIWRRGDTKHKITADYGFKDNGKEKVETKEVDHRAKIAATDFKIPVRPGYDFFGWQMEELGGVKFKNQPYDFNNIVTDDIKLKAVWIADPRYSVTVNHVFLKEGVTTEQYLKAHDKAMVENTKSQKIDDLRAGSIYEAKALYNDDKVFADANYKGVLITDKNENNVVNIIYQHYMKHPLTVHYVDKAGKKIRDDDKSMVENQRYDVVFAKSIKGFKPEESFKAVEYKIKNGKYENAEATFKYDDVRVIARADDKQVRPDGYTRYVFKVADGQEKDGSVIDYEGKKADKPIVFDAMAGLKAEELPIAKNAEANKGFTFEGWTSKLFNKEGDKGTDGPKALPKGDEVAKGEKAVYDAQFKPIAVSPKPEPPKPVPPKPEPPKPVPPAPEPPAPESEPAPEPEPIIEMATTGANVAIIAGICVSLVALGVATMLLRKKMK